MASLVHARGKARFTSVETPRPVGLSLKRASDILIALSGIFLLVPLLVICFAAITLSSPGPVLFRHRRIGFNGKPFFCLKFRTMVTDAPQRLRRLLDSDPAAAAEWASSSSSRSGSSWCHPIRVSLR